MTKNEELKLEAAKAKNPDAGRIVLVKLTGISANKVRAWLNKRQPTGTKQAVIKPDIETVSVNSILAQHDIAGKAISLLKSARAGQLIADDVLRRTLGAGNDRWNHAKKSAALAGYFAMLPDKRMVWGKPETVELLIAKLKELL